MGVFFFFNGGPEVIRTPDLVGANDALYQLSYNGITGSHQKLRI